MLINNKEFLIRSYKMPQPALESYVSQLLSKYQFADRAKRDALNALKFYKNLSPRLEMFVFNDGTRKDLVCLNGTIPVSYKGVTYNIPICVWLLDTHPFHSPMCFVKPTADMEIKISRHVDSSGRIYLPYLHEWNPNSSDLLGLIQVMIIVFGETPPVYSRPKSEPENITTFPTNPFSPPRPPSSFGPQPSLPNQYQPFPGIPGTTNYQAQPVTNNFPNFPAYPPVPPTSGYSSFPPSLPYPPYGTESGAVRPNTFQGSYPAYPPTSGATTTVNLPPQIAGTQAIGAGTQGLSNTGTISDEHIKASLLSAVEDKLKKRLKEIVAQTQAEMEVLKKTQEDLGSGKTKLESMCRQLEFEQTELENSIRILTSKNDEMQDLLTKLEGQETVDIDEVVTTTAPLYKQLLNAFAEESATEDAIYYLGEALRKGVIDLDVFLKKVRELSRKQFMLRALMQKCRQKAGLPY